MINVLQTKWVIMADNKKILSYRGFKTLDKMYFGAIKLFPHLSAAKAFIESSKYANCESITYHKVTSHIVEVEDENN